jgi:hypothetical protein
LHPFEFEVIYIKAHTFYGLKNIVNKIMGGWIINIIVFLCGDVENILAKAKVY